MERQSERGMVPQHLLSRALNPHVNMQAQVKTGRRRRRSFIHFSKDKRQYFRLLSGKVHMV